MVHTGFQAYPSKHRACTHICCVNTPYKVAITGVISACMVGRAAGSIHAVQGLLSSLSGTAVWYSRYPLKLTSLA